MSRYQRERGAAFEREIANDLRDSFGVSVKRNIGQARDGGDDITLPPFRIECKRRKGFVATKWLDQATKISKPGDIATVIVRTDGRAAVVVMHYEDWKKLAREEIVPPGIFE